MSVLSDFVCFGKITTMQKRLFALFTAFLLTACTSPPPLPKLPNDAVIVAFGDSLTLGTGAHKGYPERLADIIKRPVINAGIRGETSASAKKRLPQIIKQHAPDLLIICTGGNDFLRKISGTEENLRDIVIAAQTANIAVVLIAVPKLSIFPTNHPLYEKVANDYQLWMEDDILKTVLHDNSLKSDQVHPNDTGYAKIADAVTALLKKSGLL